MIKILCFGRFLSLQKMHYELLSVKKNESKMNDKRNVSYILDIILILKNIKC